MSEYFWNEEKDSASIEKEGKLQVLQGGKDAKQKTSTTEDDKEKGK